MYINPLLRTDSYKYAHGKLYDPKYKFMNSYIEPRNSKRFRYALFFGLQAYLRNLQQNPITIEQVEYSEMRTRKQGLPFDKESIMPIVKDYDGHLPLVIEAIDEGSVVDMGTPLVQTRNIDDRFPWLPSFVETDMQRSVWYPTSVATLSRHVKEIIYAGLVKTCENPDTEIMFKLHDFGARGSSCSEQAQIGGGAALINFMGTDTMEANEWLTYYYDIDIAGFSIPASEHSTVTSWGKEREYEMFEHMLLTYLKEYPLVAGVSDSYDIWKAITDGWGSERLKKIIRDSGNTLVIRPDSGKPIEEIVAKCSDLIYETFDRGKVNSLGYKVFEDCVRAIQGDGCRMDTIALIIDKLIEKKYSIENWAFGMGSGLLNDVGRDDMSFSQKLSAKSVDGIVWEDAYKDPITDSKKTSKRGIQHNPDFKDRYVAGELKNQTTFDEIRERAAL